MVKQVVSILICFAAITSKANNIFVSTTGSNLTGTGLISNPLATIQFALNQCHPGDTLQIRQGTYFEKLNWSQSGTAENIITLKNFNKELVTVDGNGVAGLHLLSISSKSFITVTGITFQNNYVQDADGIYVFGEGNNISIKNCTIKNIGWTTNGNADPFSIDPSGQAHGIIFNGRTTAGLTNIKIIGCSLHDLITGNSEALTLVGNIDGFEIDSDTVFNTKNIAIVAAGHYSYAIDAGVSETLNETRNGTISHCLVYNNRRFSNNFAPAGIYVDGGSNIKILNNKSFNNGNGLSVGCENAGFTSREITVMNNVVYNNDNNGLVFGSNAANIKKSVVNNNTFFKNGTFQTFTLEINLQNSDSCTVVNNIAIPRSDSHYGVGIFGYTTTNLTVDHNLIYRYSGNTSYLYVTDDPAQFVPVNNITGNPHFTDTSTAPPVFNLSNVSPAINNGNNSYFLATDKDANDQYRIVNGTVDVGAYERQDGGCPLTHTITDAQLLKGKFAASQNISISRSAESVLSNTLLWTAPTITIGSQIKIVGLLLLNAGGCN
jgi:hypothetical protein